MKTTINLLPPSFRKKQMLRRRAIQWTVMICLVIVGSWASHWYELREQHLLSQELEVLTREHLPTQRMLKQLVQMRQRLSSIQQHEQVAHELESQRSALALLGAVSRSAQRTGGRLQVTKLEVSDFQHTGPADGSGAAGFAAPGVLVAGVALDNPAVAELLDGLQDSGLFRRVELLTMKEREDGQGSLRDYQVKCEL